MGYAILSLWLLLRVRGTWQSGSVRSWMGFYFSGLVCGGLTLRVITWYNLACPNTGNTFYFMSIKILNKCFSVGCFFNTHQIIWQLKRWCFSYVTIWLEIFSSGLLNNLSEYSLFLPLEKYALEKYTFPKQIMLIQ